MTAAAPSFHLGYRPGLNGLRGVAILLVLADHGGVFGDGYGFIGVNIFFVLSGFLITSLLVLEWQTCGGIKLSSFYARRALRLLPALVAMLVAFTIYALVTMSGTTLTNSLHEVFWALFYFMNWAKVLQLGPTLQLAHTWSLSLEEQFYLCWPLLLVFLLKKTSRNSLLCWVALGAFASAVLRIFLLVGEDVGYNSPDRLVVGLDTRADSLLLGCLVGIAATSNLLPRLKVDARLLTGASLLSGLGLILLGGCRPMFPWMVYLGWLAASIFTAVIITRLLSDSRTLLHRLLENPVLVYLGQISYGLYLWHFPIAQVMLKHGLDPLRDYWLYWPATFLVAVLSFYLIESPCLRLKKRFQRTN